MMRIEYALTIGDPKSVALTDTVIKSTGEQHLTTNDMLVALGLTQSRQGLGLNLLYAKYKKDRHEKHLAHQQLFSIASQKAPKHITKFAGRLTARAIELLTLLAIDDYCRTADTPGAKCRCGGRGKVYDLAETRRQGKPIEKLCSRCNGIGIKRLPAAQAFRIVTTLLPELTQQSWSRHWKPFYQQLVQHCYLEESAAIACFNTLTAEN